MSAIHATTEDKVPAAAAARMAGNREDKAEAAPASPQQKQVRRVDLQQGLENALSSLCAKASQSVRQSVSCHVVCLVVE